MDRERLEKGYVLRGKLLQHERAKVAHLKECLSEAEIELERLQNWVRKLLAYKWGCSPAEAAEYEEQQREDCISSMETTARMTAEDRKTALHEATLARKGDTMECLPKGDRFSALASCPRHLLTALAEIDRQEAEIFRLEAKSNGLDLEQQL
jgi:hypothetical protein